MADTLYSKQSHSNGPRVGLYDIPGTSTDTLGGNFFGGPYAEKVHQVPDDGNGNSLILAEGWDTVNLVPRKIKVDSSGQIYIANAGTSSLGALVIQVDGTDGTATNVGSASGNLTVPVSGSFTLTPSGTQTVNGTVAVTQVTSPWVVGGTVTATPTGTQVVSGTVTTVGGTGGGEVTSGTALNFLATVFQSTATNLNATVVGTVTTVPSGTQTVSGTVSNLTRWEMVKQIFSSAKPRLNQKEVLQDVVFNTVQSFKNESNWTVSEHGEIT